MSERQSVQPLCLNRAPRTSAVQAAAKISTQQNERRKRKRGEEVPVNESTEKVGGGIDETIEAIVQNMQSEDVIQSELEDGESDGSSASDNQGNFYSIFISYIVGRL